MFHLIMYQFNFIYLLIRKYMIYSVIKYICAVATNEKLALSLALV